MSDYNFSKLSPRDFESLSQDLLSNIENRRVERFKVGQDGGIDGRFYSLEGDETIISNLKDWHNSIKDSQKTIKKT